MNELTLGITDQLNMYMRKLLDRLCLLLILGVLNQPVANSQTRDSIHFKYAGYEAFTQEARETGKPILLYFTGTGCGLCVKMEHRVFTQPEVYQVVNAKMIPVELFDDADKPNPAIKQLREKYNIVSNPSFLFLDADGKVIHKSGYQEKEGFVKVMEAAFGSDNYRSWMEAFKRGDYQTETVNKFLAIEQRPRLYAEEGYRCIAQEVLDAYFSKIPQTAYQQTEVWQIICDYADNPYSAIIQNLLLHTDKYVKAFGRQEVYRKIYELLNTACSGNTSSAAYQRAVKYVRGLNHPVAGLYWQVRALNDSVTAIQRRTKPSWKHFVQQYDTLIRENWQIADLSYRIYDITTHLMEHTPGDRSSLLLASQWLHAVIQDPANEDEDYFAAYAQACFRLGNKQQAVSYQEKAIAIAQKHHIDQADIQTMQEQLLQYRR